MARRMYFNNAFPFIIREPYYEYNDENNDEDDDIKLINTEKNKNNNNNNNNNNNYDKKPNNNNSGSSSLSTSIGEELKIDPNYSWILKDLNLNDKKRVIDVTEIINKEEKKKEEIKEDDTETEQQQQQQVQERINNNNYENPADLNSKSKNETLQDAISLETSNYDERFLRDNLNNNNNKNEENNTDEDEDVDDDKLLEEQLTNILTTKYNSNYESIDANNIYYSNDYDNDGKIEENSDDNDKMGVNLEKENFKTSTFKLLSPFKAELFSETDTESELEIVNVDNNNKINKVEVYDDDDDDDDDEDDEDDVDDNNIKSLQKKYQKIIEQTLNRDKISDEDDDDDDDGSSDNSDDIDIEKSNNKSKIPILINQHYSSIKQQQQSVLLSRDQQRSPSKQLHQLSPSREQKQQISPPKQQQQLKLNLKEPKLIDKEENLVKNTRIINKQADSNQFNEQNNTFKKFSKSFEVSLSDLDERIDRLNNEIKIKRNSNVNIEQTKSVKVRVESIEEAEQAKLMQQKQNKSNQNQQKQQQDEKNIDIKKSSLNSTYNLAEKNKTLRNTIDGSTLSFNNNNHENNNDVSVSFSNNNNNTNNLKVTQAISVNTITEPTPSFSLTTSSPLPSAPTLHPTQSPTKKQQQEPQQLPPPLPPQQLQQQKQAPELTNTVVETLKKEWSHVLDKLQQDYKTKLEEQQRKHEDQLKTLYDEIKSSIKLQKTNEDDIKPILINQQQYQTQQLLSPSQQQQQRQQQQARQQQPPQQKQLNSFQSSSKITNDREAFGSYSFTTSSILNDSSLNNLNQKKNSESIENLVKEIDMDQIEKNYYLNNIKNLNRSLSNNPNYVSNLRLSLKTKHSRHIQDLKSYYEQEIEELRIELQKAQAKFSQISGSNMSPPYLSSSTMNTPRLYETNTRNNVEDAVQLAELKSQNLIHLKKLYEAEQTVERLRQENFEFKNQLNNLKSELFNKDDVIKKLENHFNDLEVQLTESSKINEQQLRANQMEKMNYLKKCQENEELKKELKQTESRLFDFENKLSERDNTIVTLQSKITKIEADMARMDYEYQKLRNKYSSNNSTLLLQTLNNDYDNQPMRINRYQNHPTINTTPNANKNTTGFSSSSGTLTSSGFSSLPNAGTSPPLNNSFKTKPTKSPSTNSIPTTPRDHPLLSPKGSRQHPTIEKQANMSYLPTNLLQLSPDKHLQYIEHLEHEFDKLMRRKQQLDSQLTRLPYKATNTNMHVIRQSLENDIASVDKQLASVKLELRKLNIIKTTH